MSEYWKSLPKKYCDFCKCWITDNKASRDFHERGFRHQGNVRKRVKDIQKNSTIQERERQQYNSEIQKIEAAALSSFQNDVARDPSLSKEIANFKPTTSSSSADNRPNEPPKSASSFNRFGQSFGEESETLVSGKKRALETIAKAFEKKSKWLEAKTAEGSTYYWNKDTLETKHDAPKSGFLTLEEQNQFKNIPTSSHAQSDDYPKLSNQNLFRGGWKLVEKEHEEHKVIDLQLPSQDVSQIVLELQASAEPEDKPEKTDAEIEAFKEKTVDHCKKSFRSSDQNVSFKKRATVKRNIRSKDEAH